MERTAVFPGSFDPFTIGHETIVKRAMSMFDRIIIAIGSNSGKKSYLTREKRILLIRDVFKGQNNISVEIYDGLTVDFCRKVNSKFILRGLRTAADFEYERAIGQVNKAMYPDLEIVFLLTAPEYTPINSTIIRDILLNGGDASKFLPQNIDIKNYL